MIEIEPRIETLSEKKLMGLKMRMSFAENRTGELWKNFMMRRSEILSAVDSDLYSMQIYPPRFFEGYNPHQEFEKWATTEVRDLNNIPDGMQSFILAGGLYAVFDYQGLATAAG
ncbi:MAG: GyrI-like domain-containing protein, partial [Ignavibacteriota bacterium]